MLSNYLEGRVMIMFRYFIKRLLLIVPKLLVISILIFIGIQLTPGDPLTYMIPPDMLTGGPEQLEAAREALGLNAPLYVQYLKLMGNILQGDLGYSLANGSSISGMIATRLPATFELALMALLFSTIVGLTLGVISAAKQNSIIDNLNTTVGILGISIPDFFLALCGIQLFAIRLELLPAGGRMSYGQTSLWSRFPNLIMPSFFLGIALVAVLMRYTRASMIETLTKDYIKTARSKGIPEWRVHLSHAFRNALIPVVLILAFRLPLLIGGTVVLETIFNWPGMGTMLVRAIQASDYPIVMTVALMIAVVTLLASFIVDICTAVLDPRVRTN